MNETTPPEPENKVTAKIKEMIRKAEDVRLTKSKQYTARQRIFYVVMSVLAAGTSSYFVWVLLMGGNIMIVGSLVGLSVLLMAALPVWAKKPLKDYHRNFKTQFMPALAQAIGGLKYYPTGGISTKLITASGMMPPHAHYQAEDSFRGRFDGIDLTISEARIYGKNAKANPVFDGLIVALKVPAGSFKGHTIITRDHQAIKRWASTRWQKFAPVDAADGVPVGEFSIYATNKNEAITLADHDFMELMQKLVKMFKDSLISAAFYKSNRVLLMIPCKDNMFEPGDIDIPVSNMGYADKCRLEIEQILHIIDVMKVYGADETLAAPAPLPVADTGIDAGHSDTGHSDAGDDGA